MAFWLQLRSGDFPPILRASLTPKLASDDALLQVFWFRRCAHFSSYPPTRADALVRWVEPSRRSMRGYVEMPPLPAVVKEADHQYERYHLMDCGEKLMTGWWSSRTSPTETRVSSSTSERSSSERSSRT